MKIIIGTRGSQLALWQATWMKDRLSALGHEAELQIIKTSGDKQANALLTSSGTKGLFIKEIEDELGKGSIDLAVHSLKDMPTAQPDGLQLAVVPEREDSRDVFISRRGESFASLAAGSRVGTSSLRRTSQLRMHRQDLELAPVRGNLDTRLRKLDRGDYDALILAAAGLHRLGLAERITEYFSVDMICPAVGQGALGIEIREDNEKVRNVIRPFDHFPTHLAVRAEREMLRQLGGGCQVPIAAYAVCNDREMSLFGVVISLDGAEVLRARSLGPVNNPEGLGSTVAQDLLKQGARAILEVTQG